MTICIAAICENGSGLVLASDTMVTNQYLSIQFEHQAKKMTPLSETCIALTAGDALAHTELFTQVDTQVGRLRDSSVIEIVETIKQSYQQIRRKVITERYLGPKGFDSLGDFYNAQRHLANEVALSIQNQIDQYDYGLHILVAGMSGHTAHIYGVSDPGTSQCFDALSFHAIGSGYPSAVNALIARGYHSDFSLDEAIMVVYEAKRRAENAPGVGSITDMTLMTPKGVYDISRPNIAKMQGVHSLWNKDDPKWREELKKVLAPEEKKEEGKVTAKQHNPQGGDGGGEERIPDKSDGISTKKHREKESDRKTGEK